MDMKPFCEISPILNFGVNISVRCKIRVVVSVRVKDRVVVIIIIMGFRVQVDIFSCVVPSISIIINTVGRNHSVVN